jgi:hypothetical protein
MPVYHHLKTIFVRVPKTATTSVCEKLHSLDCWQRYCGPRRETRIGASPPRYKHETLWEMKEYIDHDAFDDYYKVGIVRNPWDWLVSYYHYYQELDIEKEGIMVGGIMRYGSSIDDTLITQIHDTKRLSFGDFLCRIEENLATTEELSSHKENPQTPQYAYFLDADGKIRADFIGKYENLDTVWDTICKRVGTTKPNRLNRENTSSHNNYREYYCDEDIEKVARMYKKDIELFGYNFNNGV